MSRQVTVLTNLSMNLTMGAVPRGVLYWNLCPAPALGMTSWGKLLRVEGADHGANMEGTSAQQLPDPADRVWPASSWKGGAGLVSSSLNHSTCGPRQGDPHGQGGLGSPKKA